MTGTKVFMINGKLTEVPSFEKGDRVELRDNSTLAVNAQGIVDDTENDGLFVAILWDNEKYSSKLSNGSIELGRLWMANSVKLVANL